MLLKCVLVSLLDLQGWEIPRSSPSSLPLVSHNVSRALQKPLLWVCAFVFYPPPSVCSRSQEVCLLTERRTKQPDGCKPFPVPFLSRPVWGAGGQEQEALGAQGTTPSRCLAGW